jgi:hypothetical protein
MKLFNLDCHISVIADLKQIFENLGHKVDSRSISGHNWVFGKIPDSVKVINPQNWRNIDEDMCNKFYEEYKEELSNYDAFICTYPLSFSLLYEKFNKPIILHIPIRYEVPFQSNKTKWEYFNKYLRDGIDKKIIIPVANSLYDKKYFEFFVQKECDYIPNICEYTNTFWENKNEKFLYYSRLPFSNPILVDKSSLGKYEWSDISKYRGIVMIPYNCSTMSIFEFYSSNIPLFAPTKKFMMELYEKYPNYVLNELSWNKVSNMIPRSIINCDQYNDPNFYNNNQIMSNWISLSDFYNEEWMPYITYFDSFDDLIMKLKTADVQEISEKMRIFNIQRKNKIYNFWDKKLKEIIK